VPGYGFIVVKLRGSWLGFLSSSNPCKLASECAASPRVKSVTSPGNGGCGAHAGSDAWGGRAPKAKKYHQKAPSKIHPFYNQHVPLRWHGCSLHRKKQWSKYVVGAELGDLGEVSKTDQGPHVRTQTAEPESLKRRIVLLEMCCCNLESPA
jgi:hypothetical protein